MRFFLAVLVIFCFACDDIKGMPKLVPRPKLVPDSEPVVQGKIEVFNSCGVPGAASEAKEILRKYGLDVLSAENDPQWSNYEETIIAIRNPHWQGAAVLETTFNTKNFLYLQDSLSGTIDATIFLGKDYKKALGIK